jgi:glycosyltransferase involved in cell wall biosynthesis
MIRVQIVAPALNERAILPRFIAGVLELRQRIQSIASVRLMVVDDGSTDGTLDVLRRAASEHPACVAYLSFTGNAGHQAALVAGLLNVGEWPDVIVTMDADLEHPLQVIEELIAAWRKTDAVIVHAIRRESSDLPWIKRWPSSLFYRLTRRLTGVALTPGQADFKLWDARAVRGSSDYLSGVGSLRVFAAWIPGRHEYVGYDQHVATSRRSRFTFRKNYELAIISIIRFSNVPLRAITVIGVMGLMFALLYGGFVAIETWRGNTVPGWASTVLTVMTMGCLQLISVGILASYLQRLVFARDLPLYVIRESRLFDFGRSAKSSDAGASIRRLTGAGSRA